MLKKQFTMLFAFALILPLASAVFADNVPRSVYDNLIASVRRGLPAVHRYYALRRRAMKLKEIDPLTTMAYRHAEQLELEKPNQGSGGGSLWHVSFHGSSFPALRPVR